MPINMVQRFVVEVDSMELLEKYLKLAMTTALVPEEIAVKVLDRNEKHLDLHLPSVLDKDKNFSVILISGWHLPAEGKDNTYFNGYDPWDIFRQKGNTSAVEMAIKHIKNLLERNGEQWFKEFKNKFGDGFDGHFNHFDGSVGFGFELRACGCFPEQLAISVVHMYYGK